MIKSCYNKERIIKVEWRLILVFVINCSILYKIKVKMKKIEEQKKST